MARWRNISVVVVLVLLTTTSCDADWAQFGFGDGNTRATSDSSINLVNVRSSALEWVGDVGASPASSPVVAGGVVYVTSGGDLQAFGVDGGSGCSEEPRICAPLWTGRTGGADTSAPAVAAGVVLVGSSDGKLYAFDAAGTTGCSGAPKECDPLWTGKTGGAITGPPTMAGGVAYVGSSDGNVYAFGLGDTATCSGTPVTCGPQWVGAGGGALTSAVVAGGRVYVGSTDGHVYAFDAGGRDGCSGTPANCEPLWRAVTGGAVTASPAVHQGRVFLGSADKRVYAFDAEGVSGCSGSPLVCEPLWTGATKGSVSSSPAVTATDLYIGSDDGRLYDFDPTGAVGCSGVPTECSPKWTGVVEGPVQSSPAVIGGVVLIGSADQGLRAFDGSGALGCNKATPPLCGSIWTGATGPITSSSPVASGGRSFIGSDDGRLHVFRTVGSTTPVPPTVTAPQLIPDDGELTVRWVGAKQVDLPISGYVVRLHSDGAVVATATASAASNSFTFTGLDRGVSYASDVSVRVGAITGAPSPMSEEEEPSDDVAPSSYQLNTRHDGNKEGEPLPTGPAILWSRDFVDRPSHPVVGNGRVFVTARTDTAEGRVNILYAFDQVSGAELWRTTIGGYYSIAGLTYEDHKVYAVNFNGLLRAVDEETGAVIWSMTLSENAHVTSAPTAFRGVVYLSNSGAGGLVHAVDARTGTKLWAVDVSGGGHSSPAVDPDGVYVSYSCNVSYRFEPDTGDTTWVHRTSCAGGGGRTPVLHGGSLYVREPTQGNVVLDAEAGTPTGTFTSASAPAFAGDVRFDVAGGTVSATRVATGETIWTAEGDGRIYSAPIVIDDTVVVGSIPGTVFGFDAASGVTLWSLPVGSSIYAPDEDNAMNLSGMASNDGVLFVSASRKLIAIG